MAEVVIGRWTPTPGQSLETFEVPGPGIYEADFDVPGWLFPDFESHLHVQRKIGESKVTHLVSRVHGDVLTIRFQVEELPAGSGAPHIASGPLILWAIVGTLFGAVLGYLGTIALQSLRELRRIAQTPAGLGLAALGIGAGALLLVSAIKAR